MRAQLDDYQDNLSEVSDKMRHTNQVLNIVLIVLIIALIVILAVVVYWVVLSKG
jgi:flagellar biosynthesis/type III secretory pathway M-ring protein FliF/YscJ